MTHSMKESVDTGKRYGTTSIIMNEIISFEFVKNYSSLLWLLKNAKRLDEKPADEN